MHTSPSRGYAVMSNYRPSRPSAGLVVAVVALIMALGGTAYAGVTLGKNSVGTKQIKNGAVTSKKITNGAVTGSKLNLAGVTVPNANHANTADSATNADHANTANSANSANNAANLGGVPAAGYAQSSCNSLTGAIKGFAHINDAAVSTTTLSTAGVEAPYNCSGESVEAQRISTGKYEVKFIGSPVAIAMATPMDTTGSTSWFVNSASVNRIGAGDFFVQLWNDPTSTFFNGSFNVLTP
ncbi:MAG TPA: hypothetical protein VFQ42_10435 [Mycobacterium sp.]|nr:hypothetical protein [Mycobacterium sp.]